MPFDFDAIVVGAGLAGLEATRQLARRGHRVMLVDVKAAVDRAVRTTGIFVRRTLEDFALPPACVGPAVRRVVLHSPAGREVVLESGRDEFRVGRMGALYTQMLAECEALGAEWWPVTRYGSSVALGDGEGEGSAVWLERGGRRWRVRTRLLVGADGAVSRVAQHLGLDVNREFIVGVEDVLEGSVLGEGCAPEIHCYLDPEVAPGYIGWLVDDGEQTHVGVAGYTERFDAAASLGMLRERLERRWDLGGLHRVERRGGRIPVNGVLCRIGNRRGLLIGDAAGAVSPLTAGGLDPCFRLTAHAVRVADDYLASGAAARLDGYSGEPFQRHFYHRRLLRRVLRGVSRRWMAEAALLLCRGPLRAVASRVFFGRGSFPDIGVDAERSVQRAWVPADPEERPREVRRPTRIRSGPHGGLAEPSAHSTAVDFADGVRLPGGGRVRHDGGRPNS
jgi:flavin-dependent dehydrogenase